MRIVMTLTVSLVIGLILQLFLLPGNVGFLIGAGFAFLGFILFLSVRKKQLRLVLICYGLCVGLLWAGGYEYLKVEPILWYSDTEQSLTLEAIDYSKNSAYGSYVDCRAVLNGRKAKLVVYLDDFVEIKPGDTLKGTYYLRDAKLSGSYTYYSEGFFLRAYPQEEPEVSFAEKIPARYLPKWIAKQLEEPLKRTFPEDTWGYVVALTVGNREYLSDQEVYGLKLSGCYHTIALSGMHLTTLAALVLMNRKNKWARVFVALPMSALFTVVTGMTPSMVRAFVMMVFVYFAPILRRDSDSLTNLSLSALVLIGANPWCIASWGMQLTYAATLGIILLGGRIENWACDVLKKDNKILRYIISSVSITLAAQIFVIPLQMVYFGYISLVAPITNLLSELAISACFSGGLIIALIGLLSVPVGSVLGWILAWLFRYVKLVMAVFGNLPFAALYTRVPFAFAWVVLCYVVILTMVIWPKERKTIPVCCLLSSLAVVLLLTTLDASGFAFTALDVGQGQCLVLRSGGGTVMVDCGGVKSGQVAADYLGSVGESGVDLLIVTHYDNDHIGGIADLMERRRVEKLMLPDIPSEKQREILSLALKYDTEVYFCRQNQNVYCGGTKITVFAPVGSGESNESGLCVLASGKKMDVLITGDMEMGTELLLLKNNNLPDVDVLVAGHHGSGDSTSKILLEQVKPEIVVISVGDNHYGHPHRETLERIKAVKAEIYRTDQRGNITLKEAS